jgi:hypothetical protein
MNQEWVQKELGVPLNFSISFNALVNTYFGVTGDPFKVSIDTLNEVAAGDVKIVLMFGDRDYRCNCKWRRTPPRTQATTPNYLFRSLILLSC